MICTPGGIRNLYFTWVTAKFFTKKPTRVFAEAVGLEPLLCRDRATF
jgi:hypothetical protein